MRFSSDQIDISVILAAQIPNTTHAKLDFLEMSLWRLQSNPETGSLNIKKGEASLNTFTDILTYLMRCNTDVTSLLSATAIKSTVAYVTDYITKTPLRIIQCLKQSRLFSHKLRVINAT